ncbi:MAG: ABC transporter ATP-binding protein [Phycisphaeraceae bacterium]|nr:ABC transporter ATP-binding protein [Phycisphaeraceae bacterium]
MTLSLNEVEFRYPGSGERALSGVTCALRAGAVTAIIGPNAAGKTTLLRLLAGVASPSVGSAMLGDRPVRSLRAGERAKRIAYLAQRPTLSAAFTVRQTLELGRHALGPGAGAVAEALSRTDLEKLADRPFQALSAGQQQRVMLARALAQLDPWGRARSGAAERFLIADEPTSALDPRHALATLALFRELASMGLGVIAALHDLTSVARFADHVVVMGPGGTIDASGSVPTTLTPDILAPIYAVPFAVIETPVGAVVTPIDPTQEAES